MRKQTLDDVYKARLKIKSDISEHMELLSRLASLCENVTEFGVRDGNSTIAFLHGTPKTLTSYDINRFQRKNAYLKFAKVHGVEFTFVQADTLKIQPIPRTDLLFFDTQHTYDQLAAELKIHANQVSKFLVFHDTSIFGDHGRGGQKGIWPAIAEFLKENSFWLLWLYSTQNNGLAVLRKEQKSFKTNES